jgi:hypothetical protein
VSATDLTLAEVQALPVGTVVVDVDGDRYERVEPLPYYPVLAWRTEGEDGDYVSGGGLLDYRPVKIVSTP